MPKKKVNKNQQPNQESDPEDSDSDYEDCPRLEAPQRRGKGETAEEKRARKNALKAHKRERQQVKKMNKATFRKDLLQAKANGQVRISRID